MYLDHTVYIERTRADCNHSFSFIKHRGHTELDFKMGRALVFGLLLIMLAPVSITVCIKSLKGLFDCAKLKSRVRSGWEFVTCHSLYVTL